MLLSLFLMMFVVSNMQGAEVEMTSFATVSAMMDDYISYSTAKGGGTANPAVISGQIRLYQNSQGTGGGSITLEAKNGATITEVTIGSAMATQIRWQVNESVDSVSLDLDKGATTTLSGLSASTITCHCWGTTSSTRLYVNYLKVVYEVDENFTPDEGGDTPLEPQDEYWELVTDATSLLLDDQVVIVAKDIACALGPDKGNNRAQASVVKTDNRITLSEDVQILTLEPGTKDGTFALSTDSGYLYAASSISNQLKTKKEKDDDASWAITIADDIATIKAQGENERNWLRFNSSASVFSCYSSGQGDVLLYKHIVPGGIVSRPIISADSVEFFHAATVTIAAADSLEIYYTTDGSDPIAKQSTLYTGTFTLTEDALLKAIAYNATTDKSSKIVSQQFYHVPTITCQEASTIALAVSGDGVLTERTYRIVAYVTGNVEPVSSGQQVFDVADTADGESVLLSYYCQVPEGGVEIGMKVEMVGQLTKYNGIAEMKYGTVTILEGVPTTLYFIPNTEWKQIGDAARFAAYLYGDTGASTWADMTLIDAEAGVYSFLVDRHLYDYVIFTRMNPTTTENSWENKWNQSADITIPQDMNCATMDKGYWDGATVVWSVYGEVPDDILPMDTIYYVNSQSWSDVNVYAWNEELGSVNATWPGEPAQMTGYQINGYDVYYYVAEQGEYTHCIFNSYSGMQTYDLVWSSGKYYYNDVWYTYDELLNNDNNDVVQSTYTVAGSSGLLGTHWDVTDTTNNMTQLEDGTYQLIKTDLALVAGTYEYKVVKDHSWDWCLPLGANNVLSIDKDGIYTVTFTLDLTWQTISATAELQQEAVVIPQVFLIGTMNNWDYTATQLQLAPDSLTASVAVMLNANTTYDYQMVVDGNWYTSYDGMMTRDNSQGWQFKHIESSTTYASLYTDIAGEYTFVWNYADNTVSVIYPDLCAAAPELQWYNGIVMSQMQTGWYKLSVASLTEYASLTSVSLTNDLYNPVKITVDYYMACEGFKIMQGTTTTFATGVTTVDVNIGELMNYIKYIPNIEFVYLYISIEEVEMGYAYQTITDYVCDADVYIDPITGNNHLISSLVPNSQIWTDTVHVHETLDSIYIFQITPIVAPERLYEDMLWQIGAVPHLVAGLPVDVTGTLEAIMAYYNAHDTESIQDVVHVEWVEGVDVTLPCDASTHTMTLLIETACDETMVFDYVFSVAYLEVEEVVVESCGPYTWNGITFTESGEYYIKNDEGCIVEILHLTVYPIEDEITSATICYGETFLWEVDGKEYSETTYVEVVKENEYGCEITYILNLIVSSEPVEIFETATVCYGEYYVWIDRYYDETGVYQHIISNEYGCDSIIATLHLTVLPKVPETIIRDTICYNDVYTWNDRNYYTSGQYSLTLPNVNGCDSVVTLDLTVLPEVEETIESAIICYGETFTWNGVAYTENGVYSITLPNINGCDSIVTLDLTVLPEVEIYEDEVTLCYGEEYEWIDGNSYTEAGTYEITTMNILGCDSIIERLTILVSPAPIYQEETATICHGEYYDWIDGYYDETGVYETTIPNEYGCDSVIATLHLTVLPKVVETVEEISIYDGEEYTWHDDVYTVEGEYSITLQDINGCDSIVTLRLTVKPIYEDEWALLQEVREDLITNNAWQTPWDLSEFVPWMYGITIENAHIIEIDLSYQGLTGQFPTKILQLPYLEYLSLANNQLTGDAFTKIQTDMTTFVAANPTFVSALTDWDISYNQFTGNVGLLAAMSKLMPDLSTLQANNNRFKDVIPMIPQEINVDLSEQDIQQCVNLNLSNLDIDPKQIPTILLYNHAGQSYFTSPLAVDITNYVPLYAHKHSNPWGIMIDATNKDLMCLNGDAYKGKNGDTLYLSYPYAEVSRDSYCRMILSFEMGDANFMDGVNITDLQSTILYAFNEYNQCAFNFTAADTYTDDRINVQDVIRTVDILLANAIDNSASTTMSHIAPRTQVEAYEAEIVIENNAIKLITSTPIAALQISAVGDVHWQMNNLAMEQTTAHHAVVAYSLTGNHIPVGETIIGYSQGNVELLHAELSDTDARLVPVKISGHRVPSALDNIQNTDSEQVIYDVLGRKHNQMNQQGLYIIKSDNQYIKVYNNK